MARQIVAATIQEHSRQFLERHGRDADPHPALAAITATATATVTATAAGGPVPPIGTRFPAWVAARGAAAG